MAIFTDNLNVVQEPRDHYVASDNILRYDEGYRPNIYKDTKGNNTVGTGFNLNDRTVAMLVPLDVRLGKRALTVDENDQILTVLQERAYKDANSYLGPTFKNLNPERKAVLMSMAYQLGLEGLSGFKRLKEALLKGDFNRAALEILDSKAAKEDAPERFKRNAYIMKYGELPEYYNFKKEK